jgi:hypothetical protein
MKLQTSTLLLKASKIPPPSPPSRLSSSMRSQSESLLRLNLLPRLKKRRSTRLSPFPMAAGCAQLVKTTISVGGTSATAAQSSSLRLILMVNPSIFSGNNRSSKSRRHILVDKIKPRAVRKRSPHRRHLHMFRIPHVQARRTSSMKSELATGCA